MLWLALSALMSLPVHIDKRVHDVRALFSNDDFPAYLVIQGISRTVHTRTIVRRDGSVESCAAEVSSGDTKLDAYTCALILKRGKFLPAKWTDGSPVYALIRVPVRWMIAGAPSSVEDIMKKTVPHFELSVNRLPKGAGSIVGVNLIVAADEKGRVQACSEDTGFKSFRKKHFPGLALLACQQVKTAFTAPVPTNAGGNPVRSVQTLVVHFRLDR